MTAAPESNLVISSTLKDPMRNRALRFVLLIGIMSFFADFVYE